MLQLFICQKVTFQMKKIHQNIIVVNHVLLGQDMGNMKILILKKTQDRRIKVV